MVECKGGGERGGMKKFVEEFCCYYIYDYCTGEILTKKECTSNYELTSNDFYDVILCDVI